MEKGSTHTQKIKDYLRLRATTHGMTKTIFYRKWQRMKRRCYVKNDKDYKNYGGNGIKIEWESFEEFRDDMYDSYLAHCKKFGTKNTTIDRINNKKSYSKENCRWATVLEQNKNRKNTLTITFKRKTMSVKEWSEFIGINESTIRSRLFRDLPIASILSNKKYAPYQLKKYEKCLCRR